MQNGRKRQHVKNGKAVTRGSATVSRYRPIGRPGIPHTTHRNQGPPLQYVQASKERIMQNCRIANVCRFNRRLLYTALGLPDRLPAGSYPTGRTLGQIAARPEISYIHTRNTKHTTGNTQHPSMCLKHRAPPPPHIFKGAEFFFFFFFFFLNYISSLFDQGSAVQLKSKFATRIGGRLHIRTYSTIEEL